MVTTAQSKYRAETYHAKKTRALYEKKAEAQRKWNEAEETLESWAELIQMVSPEMPAERLTQAAQDLLEWQRAHYPGVRGLRLCVDQ